MTRVEQLNQAVDKLKSAHDLWIEDRNAGKAPNDPFCDAIEQMHTVFQAGICPPSHIDLNNAAAALAIEYQKWLHGDVDEPRGSFWEAMRTVFEKRLQLDVYAREPEQITPIKTLRSQGSSDRQIAFYIYGYWSKNGKDYSPDGDRRIGPFITAHGGVDIDQLEKEAESPGSVVPRNWVHPAEQARMAMSGKFDTSPAVQIGPPEKSREERELEALTLAEQGGTLAQIVHVSGLTEAEVVAACEASGVTPPASGGFSSVPTSQEGLDAAIQELLDAGKPENEIIQTLRQRGMSGANKGRVNVVRNRQAAAAK